MQNYPKLNPEIALYCDVKEINDTVRPEGLVPSCLALGVIQSFPAFNTNLPEQKDHMDAVSFARKEMAQVNSKRRVQYALRFRLPLTADYSFQTGGSRLRYSRTRQTVAESVRN